MAVTRAKVASVAFAGGICADFLLGDLASAFLAGFTGAALLVAVGDIQRKGEYIPRQIARLTLQVGRSCFAG